jgi:hypothetical protein
LDAATLALMAIGAAMALDQLTALLTAQLHAQAILSISSPDLIVSAAPAVTALVSAVQSLVLNSAMLALAAVLLEKLRKSWLLVPLALVGAVGFVSGDVRTPGEFSLQYGAVLLALACVTAFCI